MVLIGAGVVALLGNMGVLERANIVVLLRLWPLIFIVIGLDIIFGRRWPAAGALIGVGAVILVIALMLVGPSMGLGDDWDVKRKTLVEPLGEATSARVVLDLSTGPTEISALSDSDDLIKADVSYTGNLRFSARGKQDKKTINLEHRGHDWSFFWLGWPKDDDELRWDIGLSPRLPLDLKIDGGSGRSTLDLSRLQLTALELDVSSGSVRASLPPGENRYEAKVDGGSGSCTLELADGTDVDLETDVSSGSFKIEIGAESDVSLRVDGGSGRTTIDLPAGAAVRVDVRDSGSGRVRVPSNLERTRRGEKDEGTWQTPDFEDAAYKIVIVVEDLGSGSIEVR
jgi:hypothetical protein